MYKINTNKKNRRTHERESAWKDHRAETDPQILPIIALLDKGNKFT